MTTPIAKAGPGPKRRSPRPRADSAATRARILDCAERLFAKHGFHGTSVRDIALLADVQFALVGYHFGSKLDLLASVIGRRSEVLNADRRSFLDRARTESRGLPIPIRTLLEGFVGSILSRASGGNAGWRNYTRLIAAIANAAEWGPLAEKHFNDVAREYMQEIQRTYPKASRESIYQAFFFSVGAMVAVCARPGRIETLSAGEFKSSDIVRLNDSLCCFLQGGFDAIAGKSGRTGT
jgi:AcrR family transcriptional regulator